MKKKLMLVLLGLCTIALLAGCGDKKKEEKESTDGEITISKYKGLELEEVESAKVTDEDVEASIRTDLSMLKKNTELTSGQTILGDTVTIDYVGKIDGVAFENGSAENFDLMLGSNTFIEGFEEKIIGHSVGETFDIEVKFPEDYHVADKAGKDAVFTVTIHKISRLPELTEALLPELGSTAKTIDEYKKSVKESLEKSNEKTVQVQLRNAAVEKLLKNCKVKEYSQDMLLKLTKDFVYQESYSAIMSNAGIDAAVKESYGMSVEEKVKEMAKEKMAIEYIAKKEGIKVTDKEYEKEVKELAETYGETNVDAFVASFEMVFGEGYIKYNLLKDEVADFLVKEAKMVKGK